MNYTDIQTQPWSRILSNADAPWRPPYTVHLPIHPPHSADFVFVDCALNAIRYRVYPNLSVREPGPWEKARNSDALLVQFALDDPPFVPDFHLSTVRLKDGRFPVALADYFAWDLLYEFEYACCPMGDGQSVLSVRCRVTNEAEKAQAAHVRVKVNVQRESDVCDYHYVPFWWDASKWLPCARVALDGDRILVDGREAGRVRPGEFSCGWEESGRYDDKDYNRKFGCGAPYFVTPPLRLKQFDHVVHLSKELAPGVSAEFSLQILVDFENATADHARSLASLDAGSCESASLRHSQSLFPSDATKLTFPVKRIEDAFAEAQFSTYQLLVRFPGQKGLMPTQGGSSERFFVWVWEATNTLLPMLKLGHFPIVRQALDYVFTLQDGGYPPDGRLASTKGAVGTTGPRWLNTTGAALALATEYYLYSGDDDFLADYLPRLLRAADWIAGEIRATRVPNPDGSRPAAYGLMPFGHATDGDVGYILAITDAYTFWGLEKTVRLLESLDHPRASEFRELLEDYRADLAVAIERLARPDGYIDRKIRTGDKGEILYGKFDLLCNASHLAYCGALPVESPLFQRFMEFIEQRYADGFFMGRMDREVMYVGVNEAIWHDLYLRLGQWKKAFAAFRVNYWYGMSADTFQVQERFSKRNPAYAPWQPNASGNGRLLDMNVKSLYFENGETVTLLGAVPFAWLRENRTTALRALHTRGGSVSLEAVTLDAARCRLTFSAEVGAMPRQVRFPEHFMTKGESPGVVSLGEGFFALPGGAREAVFMLNDAGS